ncbi:MAG TPA: isoprenylcysteine carboxylmethyltransferase family protein [Candidatus Hydrogenedentes bacterium]|nr:isoprenylcysteine carboxylmethyltransferase family protein [Candidatus Hydrogenedentota bacterium]
MNSAPWNDLIALAGREWEYLVLGITAAAVLTSVAFRFMNKMDEPTPPVEREKNIAATLTMTLFFFVMYVVARLGIGQVALPETPMLAAKLMGCGLLILGAVINIAARVVIGRFWSDQIEIQPGHRVVRVWPYTWMRHPMYGSLVVFGVGMGCLSANPLVTVAVLAIFLPVMTQRAQREEAHLLNACSADYAAFQREVPMIIPHFPEYLARWFRGTLAALMIWAMLAHSLEMFALAGILTLLLSFAMARWDFRIAYKMKTGVITLLLVLAVWNDTLRILLWIPVFSSSMSIFGECPFTLMLKWSKERQP